MPEAYTLEEAAAKIGVREDTLAATLPDLDIDLTGRSSQTLTEAEVERLMTAFHHIKTLHAEAGE
jgi:hypothetical protein